MARIPDTRTAQYWDRERALSRAMLEAAAEPGHPFHAEASGISIVWDFVAHYPPGVRWEEAPPLPDFYGYPIVDFQDRLGEILAAPGSNATRDAPAPQR